MNQVSASNNRRYQLMLELSQACGVIDHYYDIAGHRHELSLADRERILSALGFRVHSLRACVNSIRTLRRRQSGRAIDPVMVFDYRTNPLEIEVRLSADEPTDNWVAEILQEGGALIREPLPALQPMRSFRLDGEEWVVYRVELHEQLPPGYHSLRIYPSGDLFDTRQSRERSMQLIACPDQCYAPASAESGMRGLALQLYALRSNQNWGSGEWRDLLSLGPVAVRHNIRIFAINPIHTLFTPDGTRISPYSPGSRRFLNPAYVHIPAVPEWNELLPEVRTRLLADVNSMRELTPAIDAGTQMEDAERIIHHKAIFQLRMQAWEQMFARFQDQHAGSRSERGVDFRAFCEESGEALHRLAVHDALYEHFINCQPPVYGFRSWPEAFRHPESPAVQEFTYNRQDRIAFYKYLYWCASRELEAVHALLLESGIALNLDLAVGADADGAEVWSQRDVFALHASAGAPPDPFSPSGQDWSLAPFQPESLKEQQYAPFTQLLRANMPEKGVIRMDHILQLFRLFWVVRDSVPHNALSQETPDGVHASTSAAQEQAADLDSADVIDTFPAVRGSYLRYPTEDLLRILALESQRRRCMVIGEDLGTVPPEVRETLQRYGIYSWRVTYFEKNHEAGGFVPADQYPELSVASVNTHDLPTFPGFWLGRDIEARRRIGIFTDEAAQREWEQRTRDRNEMGQLLIQTGCFDGLQNNPMLSNWPGLKQYSDPDMTEWAARIQARASEGDLDALQLLNLAMQYFLDRTHSGMRLFSLADLLLDLDQPNLPGTTDQYPNWSLYYPVDVHTAADQIRNFMDILEAMRSTKSPD